MSNIDRMILMSEFWRVSSIFGKIIAGPVPCFSVFENDLVLAFLDTNPIQFGHVIIIPKCEVDQFVDVDDEYYGEVFRVAKIIAKAQLKAFGTQRICTKIEGFAVPHFHYHLIPANIPEDFLAPSTTFSSEKMQQAQHKILQSL